MAQSNFFYLKNIDLDTKTSKIHPKHPKLSLGQKLWSKTYFCKMVDNVMHSHMSHIQTIQVIFFFFFKGPDPSYPV